MTKDITLQCSRVAEDEVYACPEGTGLLLQVTQGGAWSQCWPTGSAYIGSDKEPQDFDYVEFVHAEDKERHEAALLGTGWDLCGSAEYGQEDSLPWAAYRRGDWNVILCWCPLTYLRWIAFTELARRCCFTSKMERIELCKAILEGKAEAAMSIVHLPNFNTVAGNIMQEFLNEH